MANQNTPGQSNNQVSNPSQPKQDQVGNDPSRGGQQGDQGGRGNLDKPGTSQR